MSDNPTARPHECETCGQTHNRCLGHSKRHGGPCGQQPLNGSDVCRTHGGKTPGAIVAAERRIQEEAVRSAARTYGVSEDIDPAEGIKQEIARANGIVRWLEERISTMDPSVLVKTLEIETVEGSVPAMNYIRKTIRPEVAVWLRLYQEERKMFRQILKDAVSLRIKEREVELEEEGLALVARTIDMMLGHPALGLSLSKQEEARRIFGNALLALPHSGAIEAKAS